MWYLWKRATAALYSRPIGLIGEAMDRETRSTRPWRYRIWTGAWIVAMLAYGPVGVALGLLFTQIGLPLGPVESVVLFGPLVMMLCFYYYCLIRSRITRADIPRSPMTAAEMAKLQRSISTLHWLSYGCVAVLVVLWVVKYFR